MGSYIVEIVKKETRLARLQQIKQKLETGYVEINVFAESAPLTDFTIDIEQNSPEGKLMIDILRNKYQKEVDQLKKELGK